MKKLIFSILALLTFYSCINLNAQAPDTLWTKMFLATGGMMDGDAIANFTKQTDDGGFIAAGYAIDPFLTAFILKTDANGNKLWQKQFYDNPIADGTMTITSAAETSDKGYILLGFGAKPDKGDGLFLFRIKANGDTLWSKYYDHSTDSLIVSCDIKVAPDNGYIITGTVSPKLLPNQLDIFYMKTDSDGNVLWYRTFGSEEFTEMGLSVESDYGGGYLVTGSTNEYYVALSVVLLKIDEDGNLVWNVHYDNYPDIIYPTEHNRIIKTQDGMFNVSGTEGGDFVLMKIQPDGTREWLTTYSRENIEQANAICESDDGGFVLAGYAFTEWPVNSGQALDFPMVVKFDKDGTLLWDILFYHETEGAFNSINQNSDGGYIVGGLLKNLDAQNFLYLVRLEGQGIPVKEDITEQSSVSIAPNPLNSQGTINYTVSNSGFVSLKLMDNLGRDVITLVNSYAVAGSHFINIDGISLPSGTYYCRYQEGSNIEIKKLIIIR
ncbi:MAG: T9SS type A sorting domain-containing protein [bacterium]